VVDLHGERLPEGGVRPGVVFAGPVAWEVGRGDIGDCFRVYAYGLHSVREIDFWMNRNITYLSSIKFLLRGFNRRHRCASILRCQ